MNASLSPCVDVHGLSYYLQYLPDGVPQSAELIIELVSSYYGLGVSGQVKVISRN